MITIFALLLTAGAPTTAAPATPKPKAEVSAKAQCATGRERLRDMESRGAWDQMKALKKDGAGGIPPVAQAILDQMTAHLENEGDSSSSDAAEMMREFAGARAARKRC